jgi:hypothetical protein
MASKKGGKKKGGISVDFSGVESGGGRAIPDGNYTLEVDDVTEEESGDGNAYLKFIYKVVDGALKGARVYDNVSLLPQALWRFKTLLECFQIEVPDSAMDIDLADLIGLSVDVEITNETYQGKQRPKVTGFLSAGGESGATDGEDTDNDKDDEAEDDDDKKGDDKKKGAAKKTTSKNRVGASVKFKDDKGKTLTGTITAVDGDDVTVDVKGEEWELDADDLIA